MGGLAGPVMLGADSESKFQTNGTLPEWCWRETKGRVSVVLTIGGRVERRD